jgi:uncharacterized protein (DUF3084 family)
MRNIILTTAAAALIVASMAPMAMAAERHHMRKLDRAAASEQFRNANNTVVFPVQPDPYAGYAYHGFSAPAGH